MDPFELSSTTERSLGSKQKHRLNKCARRNLMVAACACVIAGVILFVTLSDKNDFTVIQGAHAHSETEETESTKEDYQTIQNVSDTVRTVYVAYVTGAVNEPGLVTLKGSARIGDAIQAAGGFCNNAAIEAINLAEQLLDGMHIHVPTNEEFASGDAGTIGSVAGTNGYGVTGGSGTTGNSTSQSGANQGKVNINTANLAALQTLPGIGPVLAQRIIDYRSTHGPFKTKQELKNVSGIGDKKFEAIADCIIL